MEIDFKAFCELVMGETNSDATGLVSGSSEPVDDGQYTILLLRKVREQLKEIGWGLARGDHDADGSCTPAEFVSVLSRFNIDLPAGHRDELLEQFGFDGPNGGGQRFGYKDFLQFCRQDF